MIWDGTYRVTFLELKAQTVFPIFYVLLYSFVSFVIKLVRGNQITQYLKFKLLKTLELSKFMNILQ
jgi:hypothetical protein